MQNAKPNETDEIKLPSSIHSPSALSSQNEFAESSLLPRTTRQLSENGKTRLLVSAQTLLNNTQILSKNQAFVKAFYKNTNKDC